MSRAFPRWNSAGIGCKGGTSATAGRKASKYRVTFPDGTSALKSSFKAIQPEAVANIYQHEGKWYVNCVYDAGNVPAWMKERTNVTAERIG